MPVMGHRTAARGWSVDVSRILAAGHRGTSQQSIQQPPRQLGRHLTACPLAAKPADLADFAARTLAAGALAVIAAAAEDCVARRVVGIACWMFSNAR